MTAKEFQEWEVYSTLEPFGDELAKWLFASVREMVHNMAVERKHHKPVKDFVLQFQTEEEVEIKQQTWEQKKSIMNMWAEIYNAAGVPLE